MTYPCLLLSRQVLDGAGLATSVDGNCPLIGLIGLADGDLYLNSTLLVQHQRRLQHQLPHALATKLAPGVQSELDECGTRQQHHTQRRMIGETLNVGCRDTSVMADVMT